MAARASLRFCAPGASSLFGGSVAPGILPLVYHSSPRLGDAGRVAYDHPVKIHDVLKALPVSEAFRRKTEEAVERVVDFPGTVKVAARVGHQTGMMWDLSLRG